jgi:hypothetical protein
VLAADDVEDLDEAPENEVEAAEDEISTRLQPPRRWPT